MEEEWNNQLSVVSPIGSDLLILFKRCVTKVIKTLKKQIRIDFEHSCNASERLASAINILRELNSDTPDLCALQELIMHDVNLRKLVQSGRITNCSDVQEKVTDMINSLCDELREDNDLRANLDKCTKKCNFLKKLKKALPSQRKYFSQLGRKMGDTPTSDPQCMAEIAYMATSGKISGPPKVLTTP